MLNAKEALDRFFDAIEYLKPEEQARELQNAVRAAFWQERFMKDPALGLELYNSKRFWPLLQKLEPYL